MERRDAELPRAQGPGGTRAWLRALAVGLALGLLLGAGVLWYAGRTQEPAFTMLPAPTLTRDTTPGGTSSAPSRSGSATTSSAAKPSRDGTAGVQAKASVAQAGSASPTAQVDIRAAVPVQIYIPNEDPTLQLSTSVQPMSGCRRVIDPPRDAAGFREGVRLHGLRPARQRQ